MPDPDQIIPPGSGPTVLPLDEVPASASERPPYLNAWISALSVSAIAAERAVATDLQQLLTTLNSPNPSAAETNSFIQDLRNRVQVLADAMPDSDDDGAERPRRRRMSDLAFTLSYMML